MKRVDPRESQKKTNIVNFIYPSMDSQEKNFSAVFYSTQ